MIPRWSNKRCSDDANVKRQRSVTSTASAAPHKRSALTARDVLIAIAVVFLLMLLLEAALRRARTLSMHAICASNLRGLAVGMRFYAQENADSWPRHYFEAARQLDRPEYHGVRWVGSMGSDQELRISEATSPTRGASRSHPSRSMFLLMIGGQATPQQFRCPTSGDIWDDLRNYGPDSAIGAEMPATPGVNRFDFAGYASLSYGTRLPYGLRDDRFVATRAAPSEVLMADKGPAFVAGAAGLAGSRTVRDALIAPDPFAPFFALSEERLKRMGNAAWQKLNSRNHVGEGQNVAFVDGHVSFERTPLVGVDGDNIYSIASDSSWRGRAVGFVPNAEQLVGPVVDSDVFLVP